MPDDEAMQQKPPDYDSVAGAPPTYDDAIKLNPARLLPTASAHHAEPQQAAPLGEAIPGQPEETPVRVHRPRPSVPKTPPPPYRASHTVR